MAEDKVNVPNGYRFSCRGVVEETRELRSKKDKDNVWRRVVSVAFMGGMAELMLSENLYARVGALRGKEVAFVGVMRTGDFGGPEVTDFREVG
jgi:hypothetical protein